VHPALLATLVYRFGIPGRSTRRVAEVQAYGQCCLIQRGPLECCGGFRVARSSVCEDVTVARALAANGQSVGFYEADGLVEVEMYEGWRDAWRNWTRSLPLRDHYAGMRALLGLVSYLLGTLLAARLALVPWAGWSLALGVWLLTSWDLVLDPAMAANGLRVQFWTWHQTGPYFGMPIQNLLGWSLTGLAFMTASRLLWRGDIELDRVASNSWFPFTVYVANLIFAMALSLSTGLWPPVAIALLVGFVPAVLAATAHWPHPPSWQNRAWRASPSR
jgi:hypothetical protein